MNVTVTQTAELKPNRQFALIRFSPCGQFLLAAGHDGLVHRWQFAEGQPPAEIAAVNGHNGWVHGLAFAPSGEVVLTADSWGQIRAWKYADEKPEPKWHVADAHDGWIQSLAVSRDGSLLASCGVDRRVRVWSAADGKLLHDLNGHEREVLSVAFHPDGKSLVSGDFFGRIKQWDLATGTVTRELDAASLYKLDRLQDVGGVRTLAFDDQGERLAAGGTKPANGATIQGVPTVLVFDWATGKESHKLELGTAADVNVHDLAFHPLGFLMLVTSGTPGQGQLIFRRPGEDKNLYETKQMPNCHSLTLHPDGKLLAVSATNGGSNGNGRVLVNGEYAGNVSPIFVMDVVCS